MSMSSRGILWIAAIVFALVGSWSDVKCQREVEDDYYDSSVDYDIGISSTIAPSSQWKSLVNSITTNKRFLSLGCPSRGGLREKAGKLSIKFFSPINYKDVKIRIDPGNLAESAAQLISAGFNLNQPSVLYSHGWTESSRNPWAKKLRDNYATIFSTARKSPTYNLMFFDLSADSRKPYRVAVMTVPSIGLILGQFMDMLRVKYGYTMDRMHMVGFSMSAHIVGVAGRVLSRAGNPLRQITALDPAGPCFFRDTDFSRENTINPSSARLVVARHYGYGKLGAHGLVGGLDVVVNGGSNQDIDPRQQSVPRMLTGVNDHMTAPYHEAGSILNSSCYDMAYKCESYERYLDGACATCGKGRENFCYHMGTLISGANRIGDLPRYAPGTRMYTKVGGKNYCLHQYQMVVQLRSGSSMRLIPILERGLIRFSLGPSILAIPRRRTTCGGSIVFTFLIASEFELSNLGHITIAPGSQIDLRQLADVETIRLNYMSHPFEEARRFRSLTFCPSAMSPAVFDACNRKDRGITC